MSTLGQGLSPTYQKILAPSLDRDETCQHFPERRDGFVQQAKKNKKRTVRWPGVEPGSAAWKATMLTVTPPTLVNHSDVIQDHFHSISQSRLARMMHHLLSHASFPEDSPWPEYRDHMLLCTVEDGSIRATQQDRRAEIPVELLRRLLSCAGYCWELLAHLLL